MELRSDRMKKCPTRAPHRSLLKADGLTDEEISRPLVAVVNSANEIIPGHLQLGAIADAVKAGIRMAGGTPLEFSTIGVCDGIAMGHAGMRYSLASREIIADSVELVVQGHAFDAMVMIPNCDKIIPGMLMAAARLDIPTVVVSGGPMLAGKWKGKNVDLDTVFSTVGAVRAGTVTEEEMCDLENAACPTCGSCAGLFTANSMNCLTEAIGMGLPGNGTIPAVYSERIRLAKHAGMQVMELLKKGITARDIMTPAAIRNAMTLDMAFGGSSNTVLHLTAIAHEAGADITLDDWAEVSARTPNLVRVSPASEYHMEDLYFVGGVQAIMAELAKRELIDESVLTVTGDKLHHNLKGVPGADGHVIHSIDEPYHAEGGLRVLKGNLAPGGAVAKITGKEGVTFRGPARIYDSEEEMLKALEDKQIQKGDVIVIRYEGPKGGPGMPEMLTPTSAIMGAGLGADVAMITDGRFSGGSHGFIVGHVVPEAQEGGPIALIRNGDMIMLDATKNVIHVDINDAEMQKRRTAWKMPPYKATRGTLYKYIKTVKNASEGCVTDE